MKTFKLPRYADEDGTLVPLENLKEIPFETKRVFFLTNLNKNCKRGFHAHKKLMQFLVCLRGHFDLVIDDGFKRNTIRINPLEEGILLEPKVWYELINFHPETVIAVFCSDYYDEGDYIRDYQEFKRFIRKK